MSTTMHDRNVYIHWLLLSLLELLLLAADRWLRNMELSKSINIKFIKYLSNGIG